MSLTKEQILAFPAGRELDALIAPLAGWIHNPATDRWTAGKDVWFSCVDGGPPCFSTEWRSAGSLIEKFKLTLLHGLSEAGNEHLWRAWWPKAFNGATGLTWAARAETPLLAVCRAVLLMHLKESP